jgi:hypothetical protein
MCGALQKHDLDLMLHNEALFCCAHLSCLARGPSHTHHSAPALLSHYYFPLSAIPWALIPLLLFSVALYFPESLPVNPSSLHFSYIIGHSTSL